jgi:hypothetical protein
LTLFSSACSTHLLVTTTRNIKLLEKIRGHTTRPPGIHTHTHSLVVGMDAIPA